MVKNSKNISLPDLSAREKLRFSFEYYDTTDNNKYCLSCANQKQIKEALFRLQNICTKSFLELNSERRVYHFYETDWSHTTKPLGFPNPSVNQLSPFHFSLINVNDQMARIFGAYSKGTFYIVWVDLYHEILPVGLKHT